MKSAVLSPTITIGEDQPNIPVTVEAADIRWAAKLLQTHSKYPQPEIRAQSLEGAWRQLSTAAEKGPSTIEFTKLQLLFSSKVLDDCAQETTDTAVACACLRVSSAMNEAL